MLNKIKWYWYEQGSDRQMANWRGHIRHGKHHLPHKRTWVESQRDEKSNYVHRKGVVGKELHSVLQDCHKGRNWIQLSSRSVFVNTITGKVYFIIPIDTRSATVKLRLTEQSIKSKRFKKDTIHNYRCERCLSLVQQSLFKIFHKTSWTSSYRSGLLIYALSFIW